MDRFSPGRDCNCPNTRKEHLLELDGKIYLMHPKLFNGGKNYEYIRVKKVYSQYSYKMNEHLEEIFYGYTTWKEVSK